MDGSREEAKRRAWTRSFVEREKSSPPARAEPGMGEVVRAFRASLKLTPSWRSTAAIFSAAVMPMAKMCHRWWFLAWAGAPYRAVVRRFVIWLRS